MSPRKKVRDARRALVVAAAVAALAVLVAVPARPALAATLEAHGYWYRAQTGLLGQQAPPPPGVPEEGLAVSGGPDGPSEISAVRYAIGEDESQPVLVLQVAEEQGAQAAAIDACPAQSKWQPAHAGRWDDRPTCPDEAPRVPGKRSEDGSAWTWELAPIQGEDVVNVVLEPAPLEQQGQQLPTDSSFRVTFEPPADGSLQTQQGGGPSDVEPPPVSSGTDTGAPPDAGTGPPPGGGSGFSGAGDDSDAGGGFAEAPSVGSGDSGAASGDGAGAGPPPVAAGPATTPTDNSAAATGAGTVGDPGAERIVALLAIGAAGLYATDLRRRREQEPRLLGPLGDDAAEDEDEGPPPLF